MYFLCTATVSDRSNHDMTHLSDLAKRCLPKHDVISGGGAKFSFDKRAQALLSHSRL